MGHFGLPLLLDKSAIQSLGYASIETLVRYYVLVLPPILLLEFMGDLYSNKGKIVTENSELNTKLVQILAKKLITHSAVRNVDYRDLCFEELCGYSVWSDFRPCVAATILKDTPDGGTAALIDNNVEMELVHKWQEGDISDHDKKYAKEFKKRSAETDLTMHRDRLKKLGIPIKGNSLSEIYRKIGDAVDASKDQWLLLDAYCERLGLSQEIRSKICSRFLFGSARFKEFAPYTYHCFLVDSVFLYGLGNDLIPSSKKAKAHIDIEYAYYFPHVRVFSSNDKLHAELWSVFGHSEQQVFIPGTDLAADLQELATHWQTISDEERQKLRDFAPYPPILGNSPTCAAYEKMQRVGVLMPRDQFQGNMAGRRSDEENKAIVEEVMKKYNYLKE